MIPRILLALLPVLLLAAPAAAQRGLAPADSVEVARHLVTEADYARFAGIVSRMDSVFQGNPAAFAGLERKWDGPVRLDDAAALYEANPAMRAELARGGTTPRAFLVTAFALVEARRAAEEYDAAGRDALPLPQLANARLAQCRSEELGRLFAILRTVVRER